MIACHPTQSTQVSVGRATDFAVKEQVFVLPAYAPELNAVEYLWAHVKHSPANLASVALDRLAALVRNRLNRLQYRPDVLDGFLAGTGLSLDLPA